MEVIATSALASLQGFSKPLPLITVVVGYIASFYLLAIVVKTIPIGIAYAIWSGMGIVLVTLVSVVVYRQKSDVAAVAGMAMIVAGVVTIQLFSSMKPH
ncbi:Multidrug transporter EmrE [compost metagenome]